MRPTITLQLACRQSDFVAALELLQRSRVPWGLPPAPGDLWLLKQHALPSTNTIVAKIGERVVGAICLFGDSPFHLPMEEHLDLGPLRKDLDGRLAEISLPGLDPDFAEDTDLLFSLYHFAICFGAASTNYDGFVTEVSMEWAERYGHALHLKKVFEPLDGRQVLFLHAREGIDLRPQVSPDFRHECHYPEKKFFLVAHHTMPSEVIHHLFNERTQLFSQLNDYDLRVLKNIYDFGDYAKVLPERALHLPHKKTPRFHRFPMSCDGFLMSGEGERLHIQLLDASREGLKLRCPEGVDAGATYMLTLFIGVNRTAELIAQIMWNDDLAGIAGLEIRSCDQSWRDLIEYLEKGFLRTTG